MVLVHLAAFRQIFISSHAALLCGHTFLGASIILLTIALRAMMYPLNAWSIRSSIRDAGDRPESKSGAGKI